MSSERAPSATALPREGPIVVAIRRGLVAPVTWTTPSKPPFDLGADGPPAEVRGWRSVRASTLWLERLSERPAATDAQWNIVP